jgi:hypothetical protein
MTSVIAASWHDDLSSGVWPAAREMILSWPAAACASIYETGFGSPSSEYSTNFLYTQRPPRLRRHTIPQTSRPAIDRLGMIIRQRCQASDHLCPRFERAAESISLLLVISDPRYPKDDELGAAAKGTAGSDKTAATSRRVA